MSSGDSEKGVRKGSITAKSTTDPVLRNALRYTISAKEYQALHHYVLSRSKVLKRNTPSVGQVERLVDRKGKGDDYNASAVRASLRVFLATGAGLKAWSILKERLFGRGQPTQKTSLWKSPNLRLALSLSTILLFHRLLFRFFTRLRVHLLTPDAHPFRKRNPKTSKTLTSRYAPAVGASLAGFMLGVYPGDQLRITIAIYVLSRAAEETYNLAEEQGWIWGPKGSKWEKPKWFGSWMLMPIACGQLLHAFVFDRDCFPEAYGNFILKYSPQYVQDRPEDYPANLPWPSSNDIVDNLATISRLKFPPFISPILFPNQETLPPSLTSTASITSAAHPLITSLSCALLHPSDPSCLRTYLTYWIRVFPKLARFFGIIYAVLSIPKYKSFYNSPIASLDRLARSILRITTFISGAIGTSWGAICLFQALLPRNTLATQRYFLGGFMGGLWAYIDRTTGRGNFMYSMRLSMLSAWKVGVKRGWWKGVKGGDVWLFVGALAAVNVVFTKDEQAIKGGMARWVVKGLRGESVGILRDDVEEAVEERDL